MAVLVDLQQVTVRRVDGALFEDLSLTVSDGDRVGVVGSNGAGKSTLLRTAAGFEPPDEGRVLRGRGARVGYLDQVPELPAGSVRSAVGPGWEAESALERLGMGPLIDAQVSTLSGGEAKRVALAGVLAQPSELLVLRRAHQPPRPRRGGVARAAPGHLARGPWCWSPTTATSSIGSPPG